MTLLRHRHGGSELIGLNTLLAFDLGGVLAGLGCSTASSAAATGARGIATPSRHGQPSASARPETRCQGGRQPADRERPHRRVPQHRIELGRSMKVACWLSDNAVKRRPSYGQQAIAGQQSAPRWRRNRSGPDAVGSGAVGALRGRVAAQATSVSPATFVKPQRVTSHTNTSRFCLQSLPEAI